MYSFGKSIFGSSSSHSNDDDSMEIPKDEIYGINFICVNLSIQQMNVRTFQIFDI